MESGRVIAPLIAVVMIAQQVGANAIRDALFLTNYPVTDYPYLVISAAILSFPAAQRTGRLLARIGPARLVPVAFGLSGLLFLIEYRLLDLAPRVATFLLYAHSSVLGSLVVSTYWSLLNERFDPHSAKPLLSRVAGGAALGGLVGGIGAGQAGAYMPPALLLPVLASACALCGGAVLWMSRGALAQSRHSAETGSAAQSAWHEIRRVPYLSDLAIVSALAACLAILADFCLKAEVSMNVKSNEEMVRFFGFFYAATAMAAFFVQTTLGKAALRHLGLAGSVACHPIAVAIASLIGFIVPAPWRGILPRGMDLTFRNSLFRAGYELLYTPLGEASKRSAKALIDVGLDSLGKGIGAALLFAMAWIGPGQPAFWISLVVIVAAAVAELAAIHPLRSGYIGALEDGLRNRGGEMKQLAEYTATDFQTARSLVGLDSSSILGALERASGMRTRYERDEDPVMQAAADLRSDDIQVIRRVLKESRGNPRLAMFVIPLLARRELVREAVAYLQELGAGITGQLSDALLNPETPEVIRKRLPRVLEASASDRTISALLAALSDRSFEVRRRCGTSLLALCSSHPELVAPTDALLARVASELESRSSPRSVERNDLTDHVFVLLEIALRREPIRIAGQALRSSDLHLRGTAVEYLETLLPDEIYTRLFAHLDLPGISVSASRRSADEVKEELLRAHETSRSWNREKP